MSAEEELECPACGARYPAGLSICTACGSVLAASTSALDEELDDGPREGTLEIVRASPAEADDEGEAPEPEDLFEAEAHPRRVLLCTLFADDAAELVEQLESAGIGARAVPVDMEDPTETAAEVLVHHARLTDAEAILVAYMDDPSLLDDVAFEDEDEDEREDADGEEEEEDGFVVVTSGFLTSMGTMAQRLQHEGIDVQLIPKEREPDEPVDDVRGWAGLAVRRSDADRARDTLGIRA